MKLSNRLKLLAAIVILMLLPLLGSIIRYGELQVSMDILPANDLVQPGFNAYVFGILGAMFCMIFAFILFPGRFGFQTQSNQTSAEALQEKSIKLPYWFWLGTIVTACSWWVMWGDYQTFGALTHFMFVPLWCGFICMLDGWLYQRNNRVSFISSRGKQLIIMSFFSIFAWYYFEYLNLLVLKNWYYPNIDLIAKPQTYFWSALTFATIWPALFTWYNLALTFPKIRNLYARGPKISFSDTSQNVMFGVGCVLLTVTAIWPHFLFWLIWLGPILVLCVTLAKMKVWTPVHDIVKGNWAPTILIALATLVNSLFWEFWNYGSALNNPNFWKYDLPYVQTLLVFEMPLLGYSGYLFYGVECWVMYILFGKLFGYNSQLDLVSGKHSTIGIRPSRSEVAQQ